MAGKHGKKQLNTDILAPIKVATFGIWPLGATENEKSAWKQHCESIDGSGHQLYQARNPAQNENPKETECE